MHPYIPNTPEDRKKMLQVIGKSDIDELFAVIPESLRLNEDLNIPEAQSEMEVYRRAVQLAEQNADAVHYTCFMGGGAYDHYIPAVVPYLISRPEFQTAYTPYQPEVSQGTLQAIFEYQSLICRLTGMEVSNASLYDGGTALAEAARMATTITKRTKHYIAGTIHPHYLQVLQTYGIGQNLEFFQFANNDGTADLDALQKAIREEPPASVILQNPNFYGTIENGKPIGELAHSADALFIVSVDPISLGILLPPGEYGADIVTGEGQSLGIPLSFGGPYLGIFASKQKYIRFMPGRIAGETVDVDGKRGYVLVLQTREQQIKRERATSNICTNQGLMMLAATIYMALLGKHGIAEVARLSSAHAHYLAEKITEIPGFSLAIPKPFFKEFLVRTPAPPSEILQRCAEEKILAGIDTSQWEELIPGLLIAVTEKRTKEEMDHFVHVLKEFQIGQTVAAAATHTAE